MLQSFLRDIKKVYLIYFYLTFFTDNKWWRWRCAQKLPSTLCSWERNTGCTISSFLFSIHRWNAWIWNFSYCCHGPQCNYFFRFFPVCRKPCTTKESFWFRKKPWKCPAFQQTEGYCHRTFVKRSKSFREKQLSQTLNQFGSRYSITSWKLKPYPILLQNCWLNFPCLWLWYILESS